MSSVQARRTKPLATRAAGLSGALQQQFLVLHERRVQRAPVVAGAIAQHVGEHFHVAVGARRGRGIEYALRGGLGIALVPGQVDVDGIAQRIAAS